MATTDSKTAQCPPHADTLPEIAKSAEGALSFVTTSRTKRGRLVDVDYFDVPTEFSPRNAIVGLNAMMEFMAAMKTSDDEERPHDLVRILSEAGRKAFRENRSVSSAAAIEFLDTAQEFLRFAAKNCDWPMYLEARIAKKEAEADWYEGYLAEMKSDAVDRMNAARACKRAKAVAQNAQRREAA